MTLECYLKKTATVCFVLSTVCLFSFVLNIASKQIASVLVGFRTTPLWINQLWRDETLKRQDAPLEALFAWCLTSRQHKLRREGNQLMRLSIPISYSLRYHSLSSHSCQFSLFYLCLWISGFSPSYFISMEASVNVNRTKQHNLIQTIGYQLVQILNEVVALLFELFAITEIGIDSWGFVTSSSRLQIWTRFGRWLLWQ